MQKLFREAEVQKRLLSVRSRWIDSKTKFLQFFMKFRHAPFSGKILASWLARLPWAFFRLSRDATCAWHSFYSWSLSAHQSERLVPPQKKLILHTPKMTLYHYLYHLYHHSYVLCSFHFLSKLFQSQDIGVHHHHYIASRATRSSDTWPRLKWNQCIKSLSNFSNWF